MCSWPPAPCSCCPYRIPRNSKPLQPPAVMLAETCRSSPVWQSSGRLQTRCALHHVNMSTHRCHSHPWQLQPSAAGSVTMLDHTLASPAVVLNLSSCHSDANGIASCTPQVAVLQMRPHTWSDLLLSSCTCPATCSLMVWGSWWWEQRTAACCCLGKAARLSAAPSPCQLCLPSCPALGAWMLGTGSLLLHVMAGCTASGPAA